MTETARSRSVTNPTGLRSSISTTEPTLRSRMSSAISRTVRSGGAVTTDSVMTSRISTSARVYNRSAVAVLTPVQRARVRRVEALIRVAAPALDLLLFAGDRLSRVAGRNEVDPEPAHRTVFAGSGRTPIGGPPERTG